MKHCIWTEYSGTHFGKYYNHLAVERCVHLDEITKWKTRQDFFSFLSNVQLYLKIYYIVSNLLLIITIIILQKAANTKGHVHPMCRLLSSLSVTHNFSWHQICVLRIRERIIAAWQPKSSEILLMSAISQRFKCSIFFKNVSCFFLPFLNSH